MSKDIIDQLEQADNGSRELDGEISLEVVREKYPDAYFVDNDKSVIQLLPGLTTGASSELPYYTSSLDEAMTLVPKGVNITVVFLHDGTALVSQESAPDMSLPMDHIYSSPAIGVACEALKARRDVNG